MPHDPNVIPVEWTAAAMKGLARRRFGPLAGSLNDEATIAVAHEAGAVLAAIWPLVTAQVEEAEAAAAKYHDWWIKARDERDSYAAELVSGRP